MCHVSLTRVAVPMTIPRMGLRSAFQHLVHLLPAWWTSCSYDQHRPRALCATRGIEARCDALGPYALVSLISRELDQAQNLFVGETKRSKTSFNTSLKLFFPVPCFGGGCRKYMRFPTLSLHPNHQFDRPRIGQETRLLR